MAMVGNGVWDVYVETGLISQRAEDRIVRVLGVTAKFVFIFGKELRVAGRWEMEDLSSHACDAVVSAHDGQGSSLEEVSFQKIKGYHDCDYVLQGWPLRCYH